MTSPAELNEHDCFAHTEVKASTAAKHSLPPQFPEGACAQEEFQCHCGPFIANHNNSPNFDPGANRNEAPSIGAAPRDEMQGGCGVQTEQEVVLDEEILPGDLPNVEGMEGRNNRTDSTKKWQENEAGIERQRRLLDELNKIHAQLEARYVRFRRAAKSEQTSVDKWQRALVEAGNQVSTFAALTADQQEKLEEIERRVDACRDGAEVPVSTDKNQQLMQHTARMAPETQRGTKKESEMNSDLQTENTSEYVANPKRDFASSGLRAKFAQDVLGSCVDALDDSSLLPDEANACNSHVPSSKNGRTKDRTEKDEFNRDSRRSPGPDEISQQGHTTPTRGTLHSGIGMLLGMDAQGNCYVDAMIGGGPADASGKLKLHDRILSVNGTNVKGMKLSEVTALFLGSVQTPALITIETGSTIRTVEVMRDRVEVPEYFPIHALPNHQGSHRTLSQSPERSGRNHLDNNPPQPPSTEDLRTSHAKQQHDSDGQPYMSSSGQMRLALLTHGWQHDIEPFVVLANALVERGHIVYVAAPERYMPHFKGAHADWFIPLAHDPHSLISGKRHRVQLQKAIDCQDIKSLRHFSRHLGNPCAASNASAIWHSCAGNRTFCASLSERARIHNSTTPVHESLPCVDALVFHVSLSSIALSVSEVMSIPAIGVVLSSEILPSLKPVNMTGETTDTSDSKQTGLPSLHLDSWRLLSHSQTASETLYVRREMGLPLTIDPETGHCVCHAQAAGWLLAASALLPALPRMDIPGVNNILESCIVTGAWQPSPFDAQVANTLTRLSPSVEEKVDAFFAAGPPPVFVSFAGMVVVSNRMLECVTAALLELNLRAIFDGDFDGISASQLDIDGAISVLLVQNLPLAPLLTKCCCVIHHGCPGTFHAALLASCPSVIVPVYGGQMFWADAAATLGIGPLNPVSLQQLTPQLLMQMIREAQGPEISIAAHLMSARERERDLGGGTCTGEGAAGGAQRGADAIEMLQQLAIVRRAHTQCALP